MSYNKEHIAACIRSQRAKRRWSQKDLSCKAGIPVPTIGGYENAERGVGLENAWKLADAFDLDLDELFERHREAS